MLRLPKWLYRWVKNYLSNRSTTLTFDGKDAEKRYMLGFMDNNYGGPVVVAGGSLRPPRHHLTPAQQLASCSTMFSIWAHDTPLGPLAIYDSSSQHNRIWCYRIPHSLYYIAQSG